MVTSGQTAAGVPVPDTKLAREATELVREKTSDLVYHHSRRVFWFGSLQGRSRRLGPLVLLTGVQDSCWLVVGLGAGREDIGGPGREAGHMRHAPGQPHR